MLPLMEMLAVGAILVAGVFAFLLVRLTRERREFWVVRCPEDGRRVLVRFHRAPEGHYDEVVDCSYLGIGVAPTCSRGCLPKAA